MSTTITPAIGAGALFTQQGVGATPGYSAIDDRRSDSQGLQEGVVNASDFMVVQRGAGANMSVDIGMPPGGFACVQGDSVSGQGLYTVPVHSSTINETLATADATNPRVDQVILEVLDNVHDASGLNLARTRVLTGTPTGGTTLTSRAGVATLPGGALLLADILVGAGVSSVDNTKIRDRRKWARGSRARVRYSGADLSLASATVTEISSTLSQRVEAGGKTIKMQLRGIFQPPTSAGNGIIVPWVDGAVVTGAGDWATFTANNHLSQHVDLIYELEPAAGSHTFSWAWKSSSAQTIGFVVTGGSTVLDAVIDEDVRSNSANNTTTSG